MPAVFLELRVLRLFFLQVRRIFQQNLGQLRRCRVRENRPAIAGLRQHRQPSGVIQVRVRQHRAVDRLGIDRQRVPVAVFQLPRALKKPAIHQQPLAGSLYQIFRTGDASRRAKKCELRHRPRILNEHSPSVTCFRQ